MSRWSAIARPARASCGPASASSCCWPASAPWSGGTPPRSSRRSTAPLPDDRSAAAAGSRRPRRRATLKYFWVVAALILVQILMGVVTAHYGVEGDGFYGIRSPTGCPTASPAPGTCRRAFFWIATAWLAAGLFIGPLVSGEEPKGQKLGVNVLFLALFAGGGRLAHRRVAERPEQARRTPRRFSGATRATSTSISAASGNCCCSWGCCSGSSWWCARFGPR